MLVFIVSCLFALFSPSQASSRLYEALVASSAANNITLVNSSTTAIPPASFQRFLRVKQDLPGIVITDYDTSFMNRCCTHVLTYMYIVHVHVTRPMTCQSHGLLAIYYYPVHIYTAGFSVWFHLYVYLYVYMCMCDQKNVFLYLAGHNSSQKPV